VKILYLVNKLTKTSVPFGWSIYINTIFSSMRVSIITIKKFKFKYLKNIFEYDIVHGHHIKSMAIFLLFNFIFRRKNLYTVHGSYEYLSKKNKKLLKYILIKTDKVIFVNKYLYDVFPEELKNIIKGKYKIILNGVESAFKYKKIDIYNKFNIKEEDTIVFHPARFVKEKNHINTIKAFKLFQANNNSANVKLILAGDGILKDKIISTINELNLEKIVILIGLIEREDVYNFLEKCDLFIMPSISEGLNISFLEAMSMKTKVLVSDIEQFTYPFKHYNLNPIKFNVYFSNPDSKNDIKKGLDIALHSNKNIDFSMNCFSLDNMIKEYQLIYKELLK
jgi:glycosyltransferase involved in cell wall biosynthesis